MESCEGQISEISKQVCHDMRYSAQVLFERPQSRNPYHAGRTERTEKAAHRSCTHGQGEGQPHGKARPFEEQSSID